MEHKINETKINEFDINEFISKINDLKSNINNNIELELIFLIDKREEKNRLLDQEEYLLFDKKQTIELGKQLINKYNKDFHVECSINFITNDGKIRNVPYINNIQDKNNIKFYKKERLINNMFFINQNDNLNIPSYKLKLSNEKKINEFEIKECSFARIKLRYSTVINNWRLDITLIKNLYTLTNIEEIKKQKNIMFDCMDNNVNFIDKAPWEIADKVEFELEYIGNISKFNINELLVADTLWDDIKIIHNNENMDYNKNENIDYNKNHNDKNHNDKNHNDYQKIIYQIAKFVNPKKAELFRHKFGIKKLGNQAIDIDKNTFINKVLPNIDKYYLTDKVDGFRTLILIQNKKLYALTNELKIINLDNANDNDTIILDTTNNSSKNYNNDTIILDTEYYNDKYYLFDVLKFNNNVLVNKPFKERLSYFEYIKKLDYLNNIIHYKPFIKISKEYYKQFNALYEQKKEYETDGFIITPEDEKYFDMTVYKIKPIEKSTIDFLIIDCPKNLLGIKPYINNSNEVKLYILLCGISSLVSKKLNLKMDEHILNKIKENKDIKINYDQYFPIQFQTSDYAYPYLFWSNEELNNKIGEFRLNLNLISNNSNNNSNNHNSNNNSNSCINFTTNIDKFIYNTKNIWELIKIRDDRNVEYKRGNYFGNNYRTADMVWQNYQNPLLIEDLIKPYKYEIYFNFDKQQSGEYKQSRNFNNFVKTQIFNNINNASWCLDMASGNGQDLFRYNKMNVKNLLNLEIDKTALQELNFRKHELSNNINSNTMNIKTLQLDLNNDYKMNIQYIDNMKFKFPSEGFNYIICNFAFHYLIKNKKYIQNIIKFISTFLKVGGRFIMTAFDGNKIFEFLSKHNGNWEDGPYLIKFKEQYTSLENYGQMITLKLPFSKNKLYDEYLINIDYIKDEFKKSNIHLDTNIGFDEYFDKYTEHKGNKLSNSDKLFTSLYHYYSFYKK